MSTASTLQFLPLQTSISPSFWHRLTDLKLHTLQLSDDPIQVSGYYGRGKRVQDRLTGQTVGISAGLELDATSFASLDDDQHVGPEEQPKSSTVARNRVRLSGTLRNFNTIEEFRSCDKAKLLDELGEQIWSRATSTNAGSGAPSLESLNPFLLLTFADLKKYRYYYWCGFPALVQKPGWEVVESWAPIEPSNLPEGAFTALVGRGHGSEQELAELSRCGEFWANVDPSERTLFVSDPSSHPGAAGWPLRNVLLYLSRPERLSPPISTLRVILIREDEALTVTVRLKEPDSATMADPTARPATVGWERNKKGKLGPRMADLGPLMDPTRLADQAVDLNLQLMRWRIMPSLDLEKVKHTRCLLLGAGTLGCYVARTLMAWGVRKITFVDSSTVSYSNPVRQPLFEFEDSLNGGKPKAEAAAAALKRIYPGVDASGFAFSIPMPGHPITPSADKQTREDLEKLEQLIDDHDVVYLLMDSRESRWLPTVIGAAKGKLVMNVALGFDTYLVMRHGLPTTNAAPVEAVKPGSVYRGQLGCYYCNDVVAPMDSLSDRTLDQMCTVTRPGIASIASSTAVELMVSILQHPKGSLAPSIVTAPGGSARAGELTPEFEEAGSPLGIVPHQIRGFLGNFAALKITGQAYDRCTGCSTAILDAYRAGAFELVEQACADAKSLERLTGLDKLEEETEKLLAEGVDWDEEDEGDGDDF